MDSIDQAYYSMFQQNTQPQLTKNVDTIEETITELETHIQWISAILAEEQQKYLNFVLVKNIPINIICLNELKFQFQIQFGQQFINFHCLTNKLVEQLKIKAEPVLQFFSGPIANPNKTIIYNIFKTIKFPKKFLKERQKQLKLQKQLKDKTNFIQPHEETGNDVLLQYMSFFRQK